MSKENKITAKQVVFLMLTCILSTVDVFLPTEVAQYAGRDAWISAIFAPFIGYFIYRIIVGLCSLFPEVTLAGINKALLGKYLGGSITVLYIVSFLVLSILACIQYSIIIATSFKPESPPIVWELAVLLPALFVSSLGISVPARMNEILLPLGIALLILVAVLNLNNFKWDEYLPILQYGVKPPIMGSIIAGGRLTYSLIFVCLMPLINHKKKLAAQGVPAFIIVGLALLLGTTSIPILSLKLTEASIFPALMMIRTIDVGFLTRMDPFMMTIWHMGFFIFLSVTTYGAAVITRDLFGFRGYRLILWINGVIILIAANFHIANVPLIRNILQMPTMILLYTLSLVIPLFLYLVAILRGYHRQAKQN